MGYFFFWKDSLFKLLPPTEPPSWAKDRCIRPRVVVREGSHGGLGSELGWCQRYLNGSSASRGSFAECTAQRAPLSPSST